MAATANGVTVLAAEVVLPYVGAWHAMLSVDSAEALSGSVALDLDGVEYVGTVLPGRAGTDGGRSLARVVGGAGGLATELEARHYVAPTAGQVVADLMRATGETLSSTADAGLLGRALPAWERTAGPASHALVRLVNKLGADWRVLPDGTVWVGEHTWPTVEPAHVLIDEDWASGVLTIAPETAALQPGTTFRGQRLEQVVHRWTSSGLRTEASVIGVASVLRRFVGQIVRQVDYAAAWPARVVAQNADRTLQVVPDDDRVKGAGLDRVPIRRGLPGVTDVQVPAGVRCIVEFEGRDPSRPVVTAFEPGALILVEFDNGDKSVARVDDTLEAGILSFVAGPPAALSYNGQPVTTGTTITGKITSGNDKLKA